MYQETNITGTYKHIAYSFSLADTSICLQSDQILVFGYLMTKSQHLLALFVEADKKSQVVVIRSVQIQNQLIRFFAAA